MTYAQAQMDALNRGREEGIVIGEAKGIAIGEAKGIAIGEARGRAAGKTEGALQMLTALVRDGVLNIRDASKRANMSEKEFAALIAVQ